MYPGLQTHQINCSHFERNSRMYFMKLLVSEHSSYPVSIVISCKFGPRSEKGNGEDFKAISIISWFLSSLVFALRCKYPYNGFRILWNRPHLQSPKDSMQHTPNDVRRPIEWKRDHAGKVRRSTSIEHCRKGSLHANQYRVIKLASAIWRSYTQKGKCS